jgi:hypothetical protein
MQQIGKYIIITGILVVAIGLILYFAGNKLQWFGNLPGDIKIKRENFRLYAPITSMILLSAFLSFILWLISKFKQ